jgi:hypothetical protein
MYFSWQDNYDSDSENDDGICVDSAFQHTEIPATIRAMAMGVAVASPRTRHAVSMGIYSLVGHAFDGVYREHEASAQTGTIDYDCFVDGPFPDARYLSYVGSKLCREAKHMTSLACSTRRLFGVWKANVV